MMVPYDGVRLSNFLDGGRDEERASFTSIRLRVALYINRECGYCFAFSANLTLLPLTPCFRSIHHRADST